MYTCIYDRPQGRHLMHRSPLPSGMHPKPRLKPRYCQKGLPAAQLLPTELTTAAHIGKTATSLTISWFPTMPIPTRSPSSGPEVSENFILREKLTATRHSRTIAECATTQMAEGIRDLIHAIGLVTLIPCPPVASRLTNSCRAPEP